MKRTILAATIAATMTIAHSAVADADLDAALGTLSEAVDAPGFSGSVVLMQNGEVIFSETRGMANQETGRANDETTLFNIASIGKFLTAVGYYRAAWDSGIDDPGAALATDLLSEGADVVSHDLTMSDLMLHRTMATSFFEAPDFAARIGAATSNADVMAMVVDAQPEPIARRLDGLVYNNANAIVTGEVIAALTGQSYEEAIRELVLDPVGAGSARFTRLGRAEEEGLALAYVPEDFDPEAMMGPLEIVGPLPESYPVEVHDPLLDAISSAAGGLYITAEDLARIGAGAMDGTLMTREQMVAMCSVAGVGSMVFGNGCDGEIFGPGMRRYGHNGGAPGINSELSLYPDQGLVLVVLANHEQRATPVMLDFTSALYGQVLEGEDGFILLGPPH